MNLMSPRFVRSALLFVSFLDRIYRRLFDVLSGKDESPKYAALSLADRRAVLEILSDTKPQLPDFLKM